MIASHRLAIALAVFAAGPFAWLACGGGESKPPETPATESSAAASSEEPAASGTAGTSASASSAPADTSGSSSASSEATTASAPPPPPSLVNTDCGACIDKACSKQSTACGKNSDCQATLDSIHGCAKTVAACISAPPPSAAKPKKLAAAYETCAKKAVAKACKAKCQ